MTQLFSCLGLGEKLEDNLFGNLLVNQVDTEEECTTRCINQLHCFAREEHGDESKNHENDQCHEENAVTDCEIPFGLECEQR